MIIDKKDRVMKFIPVFKPYIEKPEIDAATEALKMGWLGMGSYVDEFEKLFGFLNHISDHSGDKKVVFPVHPRTSKQLDEMNVLPSNLVLVDPLGYLEFNFLVKNALAVITDSGGITEETTVMGVPCMTLRDNTERPETVSIGTNEIVGTNPEHIKKYLEKLLDGNWKSGTIPELWDGEAGKRIVDHLLTL